MCASASVPPVLELKMCATTPGLSRDRLSTGYTCSPSMHQLLKHHFWTTGLEQSHKLILFLTVVSRDVAKDGPRKAKMLASLLYPANLNTLKATKILFLSDVYECFAYI